MQLDVMCNFSYATTQICSCMCCMQLNFSCKRQLQNPKFLVVILHYMLLNNSMLLVTIEKFETNLVLVNVNKLKPYKYMEFDVEK
jgi:hypothetical protein